MSYSVVGKDFYMKHRNLDGSDVPLNHLIAYPEHCNETSPHLDSLDDGVTDCTPPFSREEISWFGMSWFVTRVSTKG